MFKKGLLILSVWCWLNVLPGVGSLAFIMAGKHAPGLRMRFTSEEIAALDARTLATIDGLASLLNTLIAVYCVLAFIVIRKGLVSGERWAFFVLAGGTSILQVAGYVSDHFFFLGKNFLVLNVSSLLLLTGFGLCAPAIFKKK